MVIAWKKFHLTEDKRGMSLLRISITLEMMTLDAVKGARLEVLG